MSSGVEKTDKRTGTEGRNENRSILSNENCSAGLISRDAESRSMVEQKPSTEGSDLSRRDFVEQVRSTSLNYHSAGSGEQDVGLVATSTGLSRASFDGVQGITRIDGSQGTTRADGSAPTSDEASVQFNRLNTPRETTLPVEDPLEQILHSPATELISKEPRRPLPSDSDLYGVSIRTPSIEQAKESVTETNVSDPFEDGSSWLSRNEPSKGRFTASLSGPFQWHLDDLHITAPEAPLPLDFVQRSSNQVPPPPKRVAPPTPQLSLNAASFSGSDASAATRSDDNLLPFLSDGEAFTGYEHRRSISSNDGSSLAWSERHNIHNATSVSTHTVASPISTTSPTSPLEKAQLKLQGLQRELAEAKAKGDSRGAQNSLEKSIQIIYQTYLLSTLSRPLITWLPISKSPKRGDLLRLPSLNQLAIRGKKL